MLAVSSSVLPVSGLGSPPKPSMTINTILLGEDMAISLIISWLVVPSINISPLQ
jgi:hypothetical protein